MGVVDRFIPRGCGTLPPTPNIPKRGGGIFLQVGERWAVEETESSHGPAAQRAQKLKKLEVSLTPYGGRQC